MIKCFMYIDSHLNYSYTVDKIVDLVTAVILLHATHSFSTEHPQHLFS